jgi:hypothetical protein
MGIETYGSMVFSSMKQILSDVYGEYQMLYGTVDGVDFQQGLPDLDKLDPREKTFNHPRRFNGELILDRLGYITK